MSEADGFQLMRESPPSPNLRPFAPCRVGTDHRLCAGQGAQAMAGSDGRVRVGGGRPFGRLAARRGRLIASVMLSVMCAIHVSVGVTPGPAGEEKAPSVEDPVGRRNIARAKVGLGGRRQNKTNGTRAIDEPSGHNVSNVTGTTRRQRSRSLPQSTGSAPALSVKGGPRRRLLHHRRSQCGVPLVPSSVLACA